METARIFENGQCQAVSLPMRFRFSGDEVYIQKLGNAVLLVPKEQAWETFLEGIDSFPEDFMAEGRTQGEYRERTGL